MALSDEVAILNGGVPDFRVLRCNPDYLGKGVVASRGNLAVGAYFRGYGFDGGGEYGILQGIGVLQGERGGAASPSPEPSLLNGFARLDEDKVGARDSMRDVMDCCTPCPMAIREMTADTPMTIPSRVRPERSLLAPSDARDMRKVTMGFILRCGRRPHARPA